MPIFMINILNFMSFWLKINFESDGFTSPISASKKSQKINRESDEEQEDDAYVPTFSYSCVVDENFHGVKSQPQFIFAENL